MLGQGDEDDILTPRPVASLRGVAIAFLMPAVLSHPCVHIDIHVILSSFSGRVESACRAKPAAPHSSTRAHSSHVPYPYVLSVAIYVHNASVLLLHTYNASVSLRLRATRTLWIWMSHLEWLARPASHYRAAGSSLKPSCIPIVIY